jgi:2-polyprenyl-3-methyl-5-hydroxy-6-metoxy-1,4-benzoquinol methylase
MRLVKSLAHRLGRAYVKAICRREYENQKFSRINERPIEYRFVFHHLTSLWPTRVLDVGTGSTALPHLMMNCGFHVTAIDNIYDYWPDGMFNRHFFVMHNDIVKTQLRAEFDFITCISALEHIKEFDEAVGSMFRLLRPGGHLAITCPYQEARYVENVYKMKGASYGQDLPYVCQMFSRDEVSHWLDKNNGLLADQEFWEFWTGDFWTFGNLVSPPRRVSATERHQLTCLLLQKK